MFGILCLKYDAAKEILIYFYDSNIIINLIFTIFVPLILGDVNAVALRENFNDLY